MLRQDVLYNTSRCTISFALIMTDKNTVDFSVEIPNGSNIRVYAGNPRYLKGMDYAFVFSDLYQLLMSDRELNLTDLRVMFALLSHLSFGNEINVSQGTLSKDLSIARSHISTSIKKLLTKQYILILRVDGRQNVYQFNPHLVLKAYPKDKKMLDRSWDERMS